MRKFLKILIIVSLVGFLVTCVTLLGIFWWSSQQYNKIFPSEPLNLPTPSSATELTLEEDGTLIWTADELEAWIWALEATELHSLDIQFTDLNEIWVRCSIQIMEERFLNIDALLTAEWNEGAIELDNPLTDQSNTMRGYWSTIKTSKVLIGEHSIEEYEHWFNHTDSSYSELMLPMWIEYRLNNPVIDQFANTVQNISIQNQTLIVQFHSPEPN